jgi:cytochrome P450
MCTHAGFHIPKGSIILPNIWAMNMNEKQYEHPERFNPERYLGPTPALESPVFGFGRRACLGVHYSTAALFITAASILSVFDLRAQDKDGKDVQIEPAFTGGTFFAIRRPNSIVACFCLELTCPPPFVVDRICKVWS